jgi:hypothetical protein
MVIEAFDVVQMALFVLLYGEIEVGVVCCPRIDLDCCSCVVSS